AIFLAVASLFFWQWQPSSLAVGTSSASENSIPGSGNALCILFPTTITLVTHGYILSDQKMKHQR
nr:hypothetical protein [Tanacetum cinerariifolium]